MRSEGGGQQGKPADARGGRRERRGSEGSRENLLAQGRRERRGGEGSRGNLLAQGRRERSEGRGFIGF